MYYLSLPCIKNLFAGDSTQPLADGKTAKLLFINKLLRKVLLAARIMRGPSVSHGIALFHTILFILDEHNLIFDK